MNKEKILNDAKEDLVQLTRGVSLETLDEDLQQIKSYLSFLESLSALKCIETTANKPAGVEQTKEPAPEDDNVYSFERKLRGGFLPEIDAYVPETVVRELGLTDGDLVKATLKYTDYKKRKHYNFSLAKKGNVKSDGINRETIQYCVVERDGNLWVCNRTLSGESIRFDELPFTFRIKESEVQDFHLCEGDIVDIAYYSNNPVVCKVVWKHKIEADRHDTPLPSGHYKEKSRNESKISEHPDLKNKNITIIGCIDRQPIYRDQLEALGAAFQGMDGTEEEHRIAALISKSDLVMIIIPAVSHNGAAIAKKYCKEYNIPYQTVDSIGTNRVVSSTVVLAKQLNVPLES